jgi:hypothetical protein
MPDAGLLRPNYARLKASSKVLVLSTVTPAPLAAGKDLQLSSNSHADGQSPLPVADAGRVTT